MSETLKTKIVLIGNSGVGKTSIVQSYKNGSIPQNHLPTIGADQMQIQMEILNRTVHVHVWDTAGHEKYRTIGSLYYRDAEGCFCVFDYSDEESFKELPKWIEDFENVVGQNKVIAIVGNKSDLPKKVNDNEALAFADSRGFKFYQTSAITNFGIADLFEGVVYEIMSHKISQNTAKDEVVQVKEPEVKPDEPENEKPQSCC
ncbi:Ras family protein [Trichomonas vaginalis G3]|uniref:Ras family protein n=1 Tax=Trichomonas vaginalis (strain ATCC PRA-98 / G3) TaxID=412133 RepID=A2FXD4_TRIV3|nr:GTPase protein [Trichomonas vaginalis G3]EAX90439.1 Ras family protein [Trichomonas vaginalis G3]KAI5554203.1 GTPase protein [Trichomonas vaginalis G3]|eukprot:XP_001303369.1 Ras family protein [Trichomonas vaginalis G3]